MNMPLGQQTLYAVGAASGTLLLQMAAGWLGPAGILLYLFTPLPVAFILMMAGASVGGAAVIISTAGLFLMTSPAGALGYLLQFGIPSFVLALFLRKGLSWDRATAGALAITLIASLAFFGGLKVSRDVSILASADQYIQSQIEQAMALYGENDLSGDQVRELQTVLERMGSFLKTAWPGLAVSVIGGMLLFMVIVLKRLSGGKFEIAGPPFHLWKISEHLIWILIAAGAGALLGEGTLQMGAINLLVVILPIYFIQGLAIVTFFFRKREVPPALRTLGYVLVVILNPLPLIVTGIGVFDLWADFRKPRVKKK